MGSGLDGRGKIGRVLDRIVAMLCCAEALDVEKFCEADPVAPNWSITVSPTE